MLTQQQTKQYENEWSDFARVSAITGDYPEFSDKEVQLYKDKNSPFFQQMEDDLREFAYKVVHILTLVAISNDEFDWDSDLYNHFMPKSSFERNIYRAFFNYKGYKGFAIKDYGKFPLIEMIEYWIKEFENFDLNVEDILNNITDPEYKEWVDSTLPKNIA